MSAETTASTDSLIILLKSSLAPDGTPSFGHLVLYTSFGVVRGRIGLAFVQALTDRAKVAASHDAPLEIIELSDASVEHYSNHLANASFDRLYVRLSDVQGFSLSGSQGQG